MCSFPHPTARASAGPGFDEGARQRLGARFGSAVDPWFNELPTLLSNLAIRWQLQLGSPIPRGTVSVVIRCRTLAGQAAVLKVSPDRARLAREAAALARWTTRHTPSVLAVDEKAGALLIDAVEPGTPLVESVTFPSLESVADLLMSLHRDGLPDPSFPPLRQRVADLYKSSATLYQGYPELVETISPELYDRGRRLAIQLAEADAPIVLLHGDLNPGNILDGGTARGLVAIDPAPCLGDAAFDAVDILFLHAPDTETIAARAESLAPAIGSDARRLLAWCRAFAAMVAMELAVSSDVPPNRIEALIALAVETPA